MSDELRIVFIQAIANGVRMTNKGKGVALSELGTTSYVKALQDTHVEIFKTVQLGDFVRKNKNAFWFDDEEAQNPMIRIREDVETEEAQATDERPIEEIIEERRAALPPGGTPVTHDTFMEWKKKREAERLAEVEEERKEAMKKAGGKNLVGLSGRDLFLYDASLFQDDENAADDDVYEAREEDLEEDADEDDRTKGILDVEPEASGEEGEEGEKGEKEKEKKEEGKDAAGAINKDLFLEEGNLPDDLDDLED